MAHAIAHGLQQARAFGGGNMGGNGSAPDQYAGQYGQHGVECEHHRRSLPGQDDARDDRAQHPRQVDGQGVEGQGRGKQAPLHQVRH